MIDADGFRANVGIILANTQGQVLWAKRIGHNAWQFPQGGIDFNASSTNSKVAAATVLFNKLCIVHDLSSCI